LALLAFGLVTVEPQNLLVEFADGLQRCLRLAVMVQRFADLGDLIRAEAQLACATAGITHIENPEGMAFASGALGTTTGVVDGTLKKGAAQNVAEVGESSQEFVAAGGSLLTCHHY
jgi:hypothetical protein